MAFTLDASGAIYLRPEDNDDVPVIWNDLTPFAKGYVEAMLRDFAASRKVHKASIPSDLIDAVYRAEGWTKVEGRNRTRRVKTLYDLSVEHRPLHRCIATPRALGFRHLAPATLSRIIGDCERALADKGCGFHDSVQSGQQFWRERQAEMLNGMEPRFPPLTISLGEDGLIYLSEAGRRLEGVA